jgi:hypothetical protein
MAPSVQPMLEPNDLSPEPEGLGPHPRRFFIIGSARTGTTLLRLVLESHSQIACFDEWRSYLALATGEYEIPADVYYLGFKIPAWTEELTEAYIADPITDDRTVPQFYRNDPCIFMLRDVREVVASMHSIALLEQIVSKLQSKIERSATFRARFRRELDVILSSQHPQLALAALYWKDKTLALFDYVGAGLPVLGVRYEDLTAAPGAQLRRIIHFLGLTWEDNLLDHPSHPHGELDSHGMAIAMTDPNRPIDTASIRSWEKAFSCEQVDAIMAVAEDTNTRIHSTPIIDPALRRILEAHTMA